MRAVSTGLPRLLSWAASPSRTSRYGSVLYPVRNPSSASRPRSRGISIMDLTSSSRIHPRESHNCDVLVVSSRSGSPPGGVMRLHFAHVMARGGFPAHQRWHYAKNDGIALEPSFDAIDEQRGLTGSHLVAGLDHGGQVGM